MRTYRTIANRLDGYERTLVLVICAAVLAVAAVYMYFLSVSVFAVVERNHAQREIAEIRARLAGAEREYVLAGQAITLSLAASQGFRSVTNPIYLSTTPDRPTLTLRGR